jgi:PAS domain S-box-containing protein
MSSLVFDLNTLQTIPLFNNIINSLHDGVLIADQEGYVKYVNTAYLRLTGVTSRDVLDKRIEEVRRGARLPEVLKTGKPLLGIRRKVGNIEYIADISPIILNNRVVGAISIVRDITEITELSSKLKDYTHKVQELHNRVREIHQAHYDFGDIIGRSREIEKVKGMALRVAAGDAPVLILGESGSGKELFAHAIHKASPRSNNLRRDQLLGFPPHLLSSELFGYEEGLSQRRQGWQAGPLRAGPWGYALSRRDRRHGVRPPGQAA